MKAYMMGNHDHVEVLENFGSFHSSFAGGGGNHNVSYSLGFSMILYQFKHRVGILFSRSLKINGFTFNQLVSRPPLIEEFF
jgi:hypothetical protein